MANFGFTTSFLHSLIRYACTVSMNLDAVNVRARMSVRCQFAKPPHGGDEESSVAC